MGGGKDAGSRGGGGIRKYSQEIFIQLPRARWRGVGCEPLGSPSHP